MDGIADKVDVHNIFKGMGHGEGAGGGWGAGLLGLVAGALLSRRGGVLGGEGGCEGTQINDTILSTAILTKLGSIEAAVPLAEAQTQLAIQGQTNNLTNLVNTNANAQNLALGGVKDAVQNLTLFLSNQINTVNQNVSEQGCKTRETVQAGTTAVLTAIKDTTIAELQAQLAEERGRGRSREVEVNVSQNVNQQQAQAQLQTQIATIGPILANLANDIQLVRQGQVIFNSGTMAASGTQAAANTRVA